MYICICTDVLYLNIQIGVTRRVDVTQLVQTRHNFKI